MTNENADGISTRSKHLMTCVAEERTKKEMAWWEVKSEDYHSQLNRDRRANSAHPTHATPTQQNYKTKFVRMKWDVDIWCNNLWNHSVRLDSTCVEFHSGPNLGKDSFLQEAQTIHFLPFLFPHPLRHVFKSLKPINLSLILQPDVTRSRRFIRVGIRTNIISHK